MGAFLNMRRIESICIKKSGKSTVLGWENGGFEVKNERWWHFYM
jgi:hypothetical protein